MKKKSSTGIPRDKRIRSEVADIPKEPTFDYSDNEKIPKEKLDKQRLRKKFELIMKESGKDPLAYTFYWEQKTYPKNIKKIKAYLASLGD